MAEFETRVKEVIERADRVKSFRLEAAEDVDFEAGQYMMVTIKVNGEEKSKPFTISNSPTKDGFLEFTKKITDSEFSSALDNLKEGDWARLELPEGSFTLDDKAKKIGFLTGGIGITPMHSILKFVADNNISKDIILLYSNHSPKDIAFKGDLDQINRDHDNLRVVYTLTDEESIPQDWTGRKGRIDETMIKDVMPDYTERKFYLCGPPGMVKDLADLLKDKMNVPEEKIVTEKFSGY